MVTGAGEQPEEAALRERRTRASERLTNALITASPRAHAQVGLDCLDQALLLLAGWQPAARADVELVAAALADHAAGAAAPVLLRRARAAIRRLRRLGPAHADLRALPYELTCDACDRALSTRFDAGSAIDVYDIMLRAELGNPQACLVEEWERLADELERLTTGRRKRVRQPPRGPKLTGEIIVVPVYARLRRGQVPRCGWPEAEEPDSGPAPQLALKLLP